MRMWMAQKRWAAVLATAAALVGCVDGTSSVVSSGTAANAKDGAGLAGDVAAGGDATAGSGDASAAPDNGTAGADATGNDGSDGAVTPDDATNPPADGAVPPDDAANPPVDAVVPPDDAVAPTDSIVPPDDIAPPADVPVIGGDTVAPADTVAPPDTNPADVAPADIAVSPCGPAGCDDGNPCTIDTCKPDGLCVWSTQANMPCDDGDACTSGDVCAGIKCLAGTGVTNCDDKNPCTTDSCGKTTGCAHQPNDAACDDGDKCTVNDKCAASACKGAVNACDDGKPCTDDVCDKATGNCSWLGKTGVCDDGNPCTTGETCKTGTCGGGNATVCDDKEACTADSCDPKAGCVFAPVAGNPKCDDNSLCTSNDSCFGGKCTGPGVICDDGNLCTTDACDPKTGLCSLTSNTLPCVAADKCQGPGTCKNGTCAPSGQPKNCDDKNMCTADSCDAATGACVHKAANDGAACDDGIACTKASVCSGGGCKPTVGCLIFSDTFECSAKPSFDVVVPPPTPPNPPRKVVWAVDQTPAIAALNGMGCSLNFNDGTDYCDQIGTNDGTQQCQLPVGTATSPLLDFTGIGGLTPQVTFDTYYDVDNNSATDSPRIRVIEDGSNAELKNVLLPTSNGNLKVLKKAYVVAIPEAWGKKVRIELSLNPSQSGQSLGNTGAGWFVDNWVAEAVTGLVEVCGNGADDNFNGLTDCADPACNALPACVENCGDGKDNNGNGLVDCADPFCNGSVACLKPIFSYTFDNCAAPDFTFSAANGGVAWAVDATPDIGPLPFGGCTLNFNNGKNYCSPVSCQNAQTVAGTATANQPMDLPAGKKITVAAQVWIATEDPNAANGAAYDNTWIEISSNNFACQNGANNCPSQNNPYSQTVSYQVPRNPMKQWVLYSFDASAQAGKKVQLRVRFNSGDGQYNDFAGPFLDEFKIYAQ